jgi:hypothetical protein
MVGATRESIALALGRLVGSGIARRSGTAFFIALAALDGSVRSDLREEASVPVVAEPSRDVREDQGERLHDSHAIARF